MAIVIKNNGEVERKDGVKRQIEKAIPYRKFIL